MPERNSNLSLISIYEIGKLLSSSLDLRKSLNEVLNLLASYMRMRRGMVSLVGEGGALEPVAAAGMTPEQMKTCCPRLAEGVAGRVLSTGMPIVIPDLSQEPLFDDRLAWGEAVDGEAVSFIGVPIKTTDKAFGVLSTTRVWDVAGGNTVNYESDVRLLTMVANLIGQTVRLHEAVASDRERLLMEKHRLQKAAQGERQTGPVTLDTVVGVSRRMRDVYAEIHQIAPSRSTVLLRGESGTGKELVARAIHHLSPRKDGPFVKVNCAALSETLLESELFGHEKGAFTGAMQERKGRFEMASGGTLFLDEIGEISGAFQAKLLRVLQEGEFERVGGNRTLKVDVRLVAATNRNLEEMVTRGDFRADLYYRINVVPVFLPPLRERREDIPLLTEYFLERFNKENGRQVALAPEAMKVLFNCNFPGNVRELENCVNRIVTMSRGAVVRPADLPCQKTQCLSAALWKHQREAPPPTVEFEPPPPPPPAASGGAGDYVPPDDGLPGTPRDRLLRAMEKAGWVQAKAARLLGLTPRQIGYALKKYEIEVKRM
ncbi:MAG: nif-specific transcriptional activator NifA [Alphaproteobacteria bacterium]|nr:nif-specific transcriptional activator NifA [Alphaproteobacteria bacterium]